MLKPVQISQFHKQGFLVLENAFSSAEIASVKNAALDIVADFDANKHRTVFKTTGFT